MFKQFKTYTALFLSMFLWGFSFVWFKEANTALKPMTIVFGRMIIATITLGLFLLLTNKMERIRKEDRLLLIGLAFCEPFLYFVGESNGLTLLSATAGSVLVALIPVFVALAAWIFLKEKLRLINYIGIV
ncbi:MAG: DMT family transporter, partial [Bacteroidales bacterium]|nr:DMT family transporter [Bacteroidales bacterium]